MQYYVIRDADTGMYWRGKGANKWGQYYNQCSIFRIRGQAEASLRDIQLRDAKNAEIVPITIHECTKAYTMDKKLYATDDELIGLLGQLLDESEQDIEISERVRSGIEQVYSALCVRVNHW